MPRIDAGFHAVDMVDLLKYVFGEGKLEDVIEWTVRENAIVVTSPSIVSIKLSDSRVATIVLGVGGVISKNPPPFPGLHTWIIASPCWVDGCIITHPPRVFIPRTQNVIELDGIIKAIDVRDPVALSINGIRGIHLVAVQSIDKPGVIAFINDYPAVFKNKEGYEIALLSGAGYERSILVASLVSGCEG